MKKETIIYLVIAAVIITGYFIYTDSKTKDSGFFTDVEKSKLNTILKNVIDKANIKKAATDIQNNGLNGGLTLLQLNGIKTNYDFYLSLINKITDPIIKQTYLTDYNIKLTKLNSYISQKS